MATVVDWLGNIVSVVWQASSLQILLADPQAVAYPD